MSPRELRIGTRGSALALAQSAAIADRLTGFGLATRLVPIQTQGDVDPGALTQIGGTGVFVAAVRSALLADEIDLAVHSYKDLPTAVAVGIALAAVPERVDPADALCARAGLTLADLPAGAVVGTGSPRRAAQLTAARPDLQIRPIRGNVDTRLALITHGKVDAVVLAVAGLIRLGRTEAVTEILTAPTMLPAPAQGALAVECRLADRQGGWFASAVARLDHSDSRSEASAERNLLSTLEAGCSSPVGARAVVGHGRLHLTGAVFAVTGAAQVRGSIEGSAADAAKLGRQLALNLLADGAAELLS